MLALAVRAHASSSLRTYGYVGHAPNKHGTTHSSHPARVSSPGGGAVLAGLKLQHSAPHDPSERPGLLQVASGLSRLCDEQAATPGGAAWQ